MVLIKIPNIFVLAFRSHRIIICLYKELFVVCMAYIHKNIHCIIIHTSLFLSECLYFVFTNQDILDTIQSYHKVITNMIVKEKKKTN